MNFSERPPSRRRHFLIGNTRIVLLTGFGGLLLMLAFAGFDGVRALRQIQTQNDRIREEFLLRTRVLERIRADLYVSGTYVRDYLLEPESGKAEGHRDKLLETRKDMQEALAQYRALLSKQEARPFEVLTRELADYWNLVQPVLQWSAMQRQHAGYTFLRDELFPRRTAMLRIAGQIGSINESQLDQGKVQMQATFARVRRGLTVATGLTIVLGILLVFFSIRRMMNLETKAVDHYNEILQARAELKRLSARLVAAQEDERRSISRELHDEVGQALTGVLVEMANLSTLIRNRDLDGVTAKADEIKKLLESSISVVRNMALLLRPSMLDDLGLLPALQWQAREVAKRTGIRVRIAAEQVSEDLPEEHKTCVYRVVQEALHNSVRHSGARNVKVTVRQEERRLLLRIEDDGAGFDAQQERGLGLVGMGERVSYLGGKFLIDSAAGRGTTLSVELPLQPSAAWEVVETQ